VDKPDKIRLSVRVCAALQLQPRLKANVGITMNTFRDPMVGLSVIPTIPILLVGAFLVFTTYGNEKQFQVLSSMWFLGVAGSVGLILASLENTYRELRIRILAAGLILCGFFAVVISFYYALNLPQYSSHPRMGSGGEDIAQDRIIYWFFFIWLLLVWPFFTGVIAIRHCLGRPSI